jgi:hypothetical protein
VRSRFIAISISIKNRTNSCNTGENTVQRVGSLLARPKKFLRLRQPKMPLFAEMIPEEKIRLLIEPHKELGNRVLFVLALYAGHVYSAAWLQTADADLAEEAAQGVFVLLARKAPRLRSGVVVAG